MKKIVFLIMCLFTLCCTFSQVKINQWGATYVGAFTQSDLDSHVEKTHPGLYVYGDSYNSAIVCNVTSQGDGLLVNSTAWGCMLINTISQNPDDIIFYSKSAGKYVFSIAGNGSVSATNYLTIVPRNTSAMSRSAFIRPITSALQKVSGLNGVLYPIEKQKERMSYHTKTDSSRFVPLSTSQYQMGLSTDELEQYVPEVVYQTISGEKGVAYNELVGLLVEAIKELGNKVDSMQFRLDELELNDDKIQIKQKHTLANNRMNEKTILYQNTPNPFNQETEIRYQIPSDASASICIYNLSGQQLKKYPLVDTNGKIVVSASELTVGIYIYSLIMNNREVDSKRMVLTD